jgi:alcohol dehydrogenase
MTEFAVLRAPAQVLFGAGMAPATGPIAARFGSRCLICTDPRIATTPGFATVRDSLKQSGLRVTVFDSGAVDVPMTTVNAAVSVGRAVEPDVIVAVGGGSVIDLAKVTALLLTHDGPVERFYPVQSVPGPVLPLVALPTTAGTGSEVTPVSVITDAATGMKVGVADPHLVPRHAICDPLLTLGAPPTVTAYAGIDALAHAIEAYMSAREQP